MLIMVDIHLIIDDSKSDFHFTTENLTQKESRMNTDKKRVG